MKKLLFILTLVASCFVSNAQDTPHSILPDTSKLTVAKVYGDVKEGLKGLGQALKVGSEHVYVVLVRQQIVNACTWCLLLLFCFVTIFPMIWYVKYLCRDDVDCDDLFAVTALCVILCICWAIMAGVAISHTADILTGFINPEYGAIKDIFEFIKPKS